KLQIQVVGIVNSKKILLNDTGIDLQEWKSLLQNVNPGNVQDFVEAIIDKNLRNSVFVDVTANAEVAAVYDKLLAKSIAVVACNKIA
ncbi:hypothetical protein ABTH54_19685, partial [Acinetobacter baumannii]